MTEAETLRRGMLLAIAAYSCYAILDVLVKLAGQGGYAPWQLFLVVQGVAALMIALFALMSGGLQRLKTQRLPFHMGRACCNVVSMMANVTALTRIPLPDFYSIVFLGPILHILLGVVLLKANPSWRRWAAILTGLCGAVVMLPWAAEGHRAGPAWAYYVCLLQPVFSALGNILVKKYGEEEDTLTFPFYTSLAIVAFASACLIIFGFKPFLLPDFLKLVGAGILAGIGLPCLMASLQRVPPAYVSPFQYTQMIWGVAFGFLIWNYTPTLQTMLGALLVMGSGLYLFMRKA
jgi:drug/metabolite transporter (DMT)-like permease